MLFEPFTLFESLRLIKWLLIKNNYVCPRCNYIIFKNETRCIFCGQPLKGDQNGIL